MYSNQNLYSELYHWKYIKKERRPNGKWRYYYDKEALKSDVESLNSDLKFHVGRKLGVGEREYYRSTEKALRIAQESKNNNKEDYLNARKATRAADKARAYSYTPIYGPETPVMKRLRQEGSEFAYRNRQIEEASAKDRYYKSEEKVRKSIDNYNKAKTAYEKTPLYKIEQAQKTISKAKQSIKKWSVQFNRVTVATIDDIKKNNRNRKQNSR